MQTLRSWQQPFLGLKEFPLGLAEFEIHSFFDFDAHELAAIRSRRGVNLRLAAALHLGFIKMTGSTIDALDRVPGQVLQIVAQQLDLPQYDIVTLRAYIIGDGERCSNTSNGRWVC
jgi:hypothetical protein